jgi:Uma2 family endonuclease
MKLRPGLCRIPDVTVFWGERPLEVPATPPPIAVEILSADDRMSEILEKLQEYHVGGVAQVWLVDPRTRLIYAWQGGVREVASLRVPELELSLTAADVFGV